MLAGSAARRKDLLKKRTLTMLCVVAAMLAALATSVFAQADPSFYCGTVVAPYSQCTSSHAEGGIAMNVASYPGSGTVNVCEKVTDRGGNVYSRRCGNNEADSYTDLCGSYGTIYDYATVGNNSGSWHTVDGYAYASRYGTYC
jgi:hypothetical protein